MSDDDLWVALADERRAIANRVATLTEEQLGVQTLCPAWNVHQMLAHLVVPTGFSAVELGVAMLRARGNVDRVSQILVDKRAGRSAQQLVAELRDHAEARKAPPIVGVLGPYTDALVHSLDMWIPLGLADDRPAERWRPSLDFLMSRRARVGFLTDARPDLRYAATDLDWAHGDGPAVEAPAAALALALLRRTPRLDELAGPGAETLRSWAN